ncbi:MAG: Coq4 family protein, partial [Myxococcota bacterium]
MEALYNTIGKLSFMKDFLRMLAADPEKDNVTVLLSRIANHLDRDELIPKIASIQDRPAVLEVMDSSTVREYPDLDALGRLPEGTLGHTYAATMRAMNFDPTVPDKQARQEESRFGNLRNHLAVTHDVWHTVAGIQTDPLGELELQAF